MISSAPNDLVDNAKCLRCIPADRKPEVIIYLLEQLLGESSTPAELVAAACNYCGIPADRLRQMQVSIMCQHAVDLEYYLTDENGLYITDENGNKIVVEP